MAKATIAATAADEIASINSWALGVVDHLWHMRDWLPTRDGRDTVSSVIESKYPTEFRRAAVTLVRYARELQEMLSAWTRPSGQASELLDLTAANMGGDCRFGASVGYNAHEAVVCHAEQVLGYFEAIDFDAEKIRRHLQECHEQKGDHVLEVIFPDVDFGAFRVRVRHEAVKARSELGGLARDAESSGNMERTADSKTDKPKKNTLPPDVLDCANYIIAQRKLISEGTRPTATKESLIAEHLQSDDTGAMQRQLQPTRFGWYLDINGQADK